MRLGAWLYSLICISLWPLPGGCLRYQTRLFALDVRKAVNIIHEQVVLSQIVGQFTSIKQNGPKSYLCLCPFHSDSNPSMGISDDKGLYHCFSCGAGGDVIKFVRQMEQLSFTEAIVKTLSLSGLGNATSMGLDDGDSSGGNMQLSKAEMEQFRRRARMEEAMQHAAEFYAFKLLGDVRAGAARTHLINRRIKPQTAFKFQLGYAPAGGVSSLTANLTARGFSIEELVAAGLSVKGDRDRPLVGGTAAVAAAGKLNVSNADNNFDRFRDRLMVPIFSAQGKVVAFGGRLLDASTPSKPKYMNSPETSLFKKSNTLFGFDIARRAIAAEGVAVIVEGYFDVIALHDAGIETAVGAMGTSLTREQLGAAARASKGKVVLLFDADEAGQIATQRVIENVLPAVLAATNGGIDLRVASLPPVGETKNGKNENEPKDSADICLRLGAAAGVAMQGAISKAVGWKQWSVDRIILTGLRELDEKNRDVAIKASTEASPLFNAAGESSIAWVRNTTRIRPTGPENGEEEGRHASPMMAALGLDSIRPPPVASISSLLSTPDVFASTVISLTRFLESLTDASDRTILAYYCAERLAGGHPSMRLQLENDLLSFAKKKTLAKPQTQSASPADSASRKQMQQHRITALDDSRWSKAAPGQIVDEALESRMVLPTSEEQRKGSNYTRLPPVGHAFTPPLQQHPKQLWQPHQQLLSSASSFPTRIAVPKGNGDVSNASDVVSMLSTGIDIDMAKGKSLSRRFKGAANEGKLWENYKFPSSLLSNSPRHTTKSAMTLNHADNSRDDRTNGAELQLLTLFISMPTLRGAVRAATTRIEATPGESQDMWTGVGHGKLWSALCLIDDADCATVDFAQQVQAKLDPASVEIKTFLGIVALKGALKSDMEGEFSIASATQILCESRVMRRLVAQLLKSADKQNDEGTDDSDIISRDFSGQQDRLVELFESESRRLRIEKMLESIVATDKDGGAEFFEQLKRYTGSDPLAPPPDVLKVDTPGENASPKKSYAFTFTSEDADRIIEEGQLSDEEVFFATAHTLQEEKTKNDKRFSKSKEKIQGFTLGLDEEYLYESPNPRPKWQKK